MMSAPGHLCYKFLMPRKKLLRVNQSAGKKALYTLATPHAAKKHMQFHMFTQQMFATHAFRGQHPHAHTSLLQTEKVFRS